MQKICLTAFAQLPIVAPRCPPSGQAAKQYGEVSEWLKEHAWKVCIRQRIGGSNPPLTAIFKMRARTKVRAFFFYIPRTGRPHKKQSPVSRALNTTANSIVRLQRTLAER